LDFHRRRPDITSDVWTLQLRLHKIAEARLDGCTKGFFVRKLHFSVRTSLQTDDLGGLRSLGRLNGYQTPTFYGWHSATSFGHSDGLQEKPTLLSYKVSRIFHSSGPFLLSDILCRYCLVQPFLFLNYAVILLEIRCP
jgi:hypothetical protein